MTDDIKEGGLFSSRSLVVSIAVGFVVFIAAIFWLGIHTKIQLGEDGQRAIQMLDVMRRPFLKIKETENRLVKNRGAEAQAALEKSIDSAYAMIEHYEQLVAYNPELSVQVKELKSVYENWVSVERHLFNHASENILLLTEGVVANEHFQRHLNDATAAFLSTMDILGNGEVPIHKDIDTGRRGVHKLLGLSLLLLLYLIGLVYCHQNRRILALRRSRGEFEEEGRVRKSAEEKLKESEGRLQSILDNSTTVIYVKDVEGKYLFINKKYEDLFGVTKEMVKGKTDHDIFPSHMADAFRANDIEVLKANAPVEFEEVAPHDDGPHTYISIKFPINDDNGKALTPFAVFQQI